MGEEEIDLSSLDKDHHIHPFTDPKMLKQEGGPTVMVRGKGSTLWDADGKSYLDGLAGLWCVNVGYGQKELAEVASRQMEQLAYYNAFFKTTTAPAAKLAAKLASILPEGLDHVIFANSGSEVLDSFCRLSRHFWALKGQPEKLIMLGREEGYHGSTLATISLGKIPAMQAQGGLPLEGFEHVKTPYQFLYAPASSEEAFAEEAAGWLDHKIRELGPGTVAAFVAEPIQGAGGVIIPPAGYLKRCEEICRKHDVLFCLDEVVSAFGRLGYWTASERFDLKPDFISMAKGLSSGYQPISALAIGHRVASTLIERGGDLAHGFTYSGHPVAAAVALENIAILEREGLIERVRDDLEPYFAKALEKLGDHPLVGEVRSQGLLGAVELVYQKQPRLLFEPQGVVAAIVRDQMQRHGIIVRPVRDTLLIAPPLVVTHAEIDRIIRVLGERLDQVARELSVLGSDQAAREAVAAGGALKDRVCLITGASRGIGAAVAERFAKEGAKVILAARDEASLKRVADRIRRKGGAVTTMLLDVSDPAQLDGLAGRIEKGLGGLDVAVLNHGMLGPIDPLAEVEDDAFDETISVNLSACYHMVRALDPLLKASPAGRMILTTSGAAAGGVAGWGAYSASKAGLEALARCYGSETRESSVRVNLVDPGEVRTTMRATAFPDENPMRLPEPEKITDVFVRLACVEMDYSAMLVPAEVSGR